MAVKVQFSKVKNIKDEVKTFKEEVEILNIIINSDTEVQTLSDDVDNATPEEKEELIKELQEVIQQDRESITNVYYYEELTPVFDSRIILNAFNIQANGFMFEISKTDLELFIGKCRQVKDDNSLADTLLPNGTEGLPDHNEYNHIQDILNCLKMALRAYKKMDWDTEILQMYCTWIHTPQEIEEPIE